MKSFITLVIALAFALGGLFAHINTSQHNDSDDSIKHAPIQKTTKAAKKDAVLLYDFSFFSN